MQMAATGRAKTNCAGSSRPIIRCEAPACADVSFGRRARTRCAVPRSKEGLMTDATTAAPGLPDTMVSVQPLFGFDTDLEVPAYSKPDDHVPDLDLDYLFDKP